MTKVEAIAKVMQDNGGTASLSVIYDNICKYYPTAKVSKDWEAGLRGVLYREIKNGKTFKKIGLSIYSLADYQEEKIKFEKDAVRMHSYIEGLCVELGNFNKYLTYCADPTALYRDHLSVGDFTTIKKMPDFSYPEIINEAKRIDVVWLNSKGLIFPQYVFEIVDSIGTLNGAFNRSLQLRNFRTRFFIVAPEKHKDKYEHTINLETYIKDKDRFRFVNYDTIRELYEDTEKTTRLNKELFG